MQQQDITEINTPHCAQNMLCHQQFLFIFVINISETCEHCAQTLVSVCLALNDLLLRSLSFASCHWLDVSDFATL